MSLLAEPKYVLVSQSGLQNLSSPPFRQQTLLLPRTQTEMARANSTMTASLLEGMVAQTQPQVEKRDKVLAK